MEILQQTCNNDLQTSISKGYAEAQEVATEFEGYLSGLTDEKRFAQFNTGTVNFSVTPAVLAQAEQLKSFGLTEEFKKLGMFVQALQKPFHTGGNNIPSAFINPAVIANVVPFCDSPQDVNADIISQATMQLQIMDEFITYDGCPIWERIEGERVDFYNVFKVYRDMRYGVLTDGDFVLRPRTLAGAARMLFLSPMLLNTLYKIYNWEARCICYDNFMQIQRAKRQAQEVQLLERDHLAVSQKLLKKAETYIDKKIEAFRPADVIDLLEIAFKFGRISLGLAGDKPGNGMNGSKVSISNTINNNSAEQMLNIQAPIGSNESEVERTFNESMKCEDNLKSILHVLQQSGAMATVLPQLDEQAVVDVTSTPVDDIVDIEIATREDGESYE